MAQLKILISRNYILLLKILDSKKVLDIKWISVSEIPNYDFCPADVEILDYLKLKLGEKA